MTQWRERDAEDRVIVAVMFAMIGLNLAAVFGLFFLGCWVLLR